MRKKIKHTVLYRIFVLSVSIITVGEIYFISGFLPAFLLFILFFIYILNTFLKEIAFDANFFYYKTIFRKYKILLADIERIVYFHHLGVGRDFYKIFFRQNGKLKSIKLVSYKSDNIYEVMEGVRRLGVKFEKNESQLSFGAFFLILIFLVESLYILEKALFFTSEMLKKYFSYEYYIPNEFWLWIIISFFMMLLFFRYFKLIKYKYYTILQAKLIYIVIITYLAINFANTVSHNNRTEMFSLLQSAKFDIKIYNIEHGKFPDKIPVYLSGKYKKHLFVMKKLKFIYPQFFLYKRDLFAKIKSVPGLVFFLKKGENYNWYATFLKNGKVYIIDEKNHILNKEFFCDKGVSDCK